MGCAATVNISFSVKLLLQLLFTSCFFVVFVYAAGGLGEIYPAFCIFTHGNLDGSIFSYFFPARGTERIWWEGRDLLRCFWNGWLVWMDVCN